MAYKNKIKKHGYCRLRKVIFVNGKQKKVFCEYYDGKPLIEWQDECRDPIALLAEGRYDILDKIYAEESGYGNRQSNIIPMNNEEPPF